MGKQSKKKSSKGKKKKEKIATDDTGNDAAESGTFDTIMGSLQSMMGDMMKHYVSFHPESTCRHGHKIPTIDCPIGMECINGYEDALIMSADARFKWHTTEDEPKFTSPDEAAVTSPSPLWHKKILHLMRDNVAMPIWNAHSNTDKIHTYLVSLGTNLILKKNTRCDNMAMAVAYAVIDLEERSAYGGKRYNNMHVDTDTKARLFFGSRINCSCLRGIQSSEATNNSTANINEEERPDQRGTMHMKEDDLFRNMASLFIENEDKQLKERGICNHGSAEKMILGGLDVSRGEASNVYDKFMPAFENTMNNILSNIDSDNIPHEKKRSLSDPVKVNAAVMKIILRDHSDILPNRDKEEVRKIVCGCLVALGTDYLLQAKKHHAERFTKMAAVVSCHTLFWEKKGASEINDIMRGNDVYKTTQFFDERNGCDCLKDEHSKVDDDTEGSAAESKSGVCGYCELFKEKVMKCNGCKGIQYCSKSCQRADWSRHKTACKQQQKNSKK